MLQSWTLAVGESLFNMAKQSKVSQSVVRFRGKRASLNTDCVFIDLLDEETGEE